MFWEVTTQTQDTETWKAISSHMTISAHNPASVECVGWATLGTGGTGETRPNIRPEEEDALFGTHLKEAVRILRKG